MARLLNSLRKTAAREQAAARTGRRASTGRPDAPLDNPADVPRLLKSLLQRARTSRPQRWPTGPPRLRDPAGAQCRAVRDALLATPAAVSLAEPARVPGWVSPARPRYLVGQCPESVAVGKPFSLLASINVAASPASAELELFDVPPEGQDVVLVMYAPGLHVLSDHQQTVHVPADADSRPVRFELRADTPGPAKVSITAWIGGTHLGELRVEITAERDRAPGPHREVLAEITTQANRRAP